MPELKRAHHEVVIVRRDEDWQGKSRQDTVRLGGILKVGYFALPEIFLKFLDQFRLGEYGIMSESEELHNAS
jgi:hypothetical protein